MNFSDALQALNEGKNVRLKSWRGKRWWVYPSPAHAMQVYREKMLTPNSAFMLSDEERQSEDWEIVE